MDLDTSNEAVPFDSKDTKRIKKTQEQIEMLAKAYAENNHPSEAVRMQLSAELGLTNRQLQMWFCNRRLKDRKGQKAELADVSPEENGHQRLLRPEASSDLDDYPTAVLASDTENAAIYGKNGSAPPVQQSREKRVRKSEKQDSLPRLHIDWQQAYESGDLQTVADFTALTSSESWQGEPYREDGPLIGFEFESIPPGALKMLVESPMEPRTLVAFPRQDDDMNYVLPETVTSLCERKLDLKKSAQKLQKASERKQEQKAEPNCRSGDTNILKKRVSRQKVSPSMYNENGGKLPRSKLGVLSASNHRVNSIEFNSPYLECYIKSGCKGYLDDDVGNGSRVSRNCEHLGDGSDESDDAKYFVEDLRGKESAN